VGTVARDEVPPALLRAWPTLRGAADLVGVNASTISRRSDLRAESRGGELRIRPAEVLRLGAYFKRRPLDEIASDLLDFAYEQAPDSAGAVDEEIEAYLGPASGGPVVGSFLAEARRGLPPELFAEVERVYRAAGGREDLTSGREVVAKGSSERHRRPTREASSRAQSR
jgi:hypothetical protein